MKIHLRNIGVRLIAWDMYPNNHTLSPDGWYGYVTSLEELRWMVEQQIKEQYEDEVRADSQS